MIKITKTTKSYSGNPITIVGTIETERVIGTDEWTSEPIVKKICEMSIDVIFGAITFGSWEIEPIPASIRSQVPNAITHAGRRKYCLTAEHMQIIASINAELEATPEWQSKMAAEKAYNKACKAADAIAKKVAE